MIKVKLKKDFMWGTQKFPKGAVVEVAKHVADNIIKRRLGDEVVEKPPAPATEEGYERRDMAPVKRRRGRPPKVQQETD